MARIWAKKTLLALSKLTFLLKYLKIKFQRSLTNTLFLNLENRDCYLPIFFDYSMNPT